jgi:DNA (cytosine-5)-methyltransferase 1
MNDGQLNIFDMIYPKYKINKPIRLIEAFGGYGSQLLSLKYIGADVEQWKLIEWAVKSIQAYKDIHYSEDNTDYSKGFTKEEIINILHYLGISANYNESMTLDQIKRLKEKQLRTIYNNIVATKNLVNIQKVKGADLEIVDTDKYCYIMTYSFPCQDLSLAGKGKGMSDTTTRSGLLWEVERILTECKDLGELPQILLMENVPQVHSVDNLPDFNKWKDRLEELGYKNYWKDLIATDYGIPQTRNRTFMISILGDYSYSFPKPIPLKLKLKDMLEKNVDEKYYLSEKMIKYLVSTDNDKYKVNENNLVINREIACSKTTREGCTRADTTDYVSDDLPNNCNLYKTCLIKNKGTEITKLTDNANTIMARDYKGFGNQEMNAVILIKNNNSKGYLEASEGDGINISSRMEYQRGNVQKDKIQTIDTMGGESKGVVLKDLRIRKLTPKECFRLMGVKDEDYDKCAKNQSNSSLYHLAGDSIVIDILKAIFKELL